jgi:polar amino acid transport system permease protein
MSGAEGRRGALIAIFSTVVVFTALALLITHAPGWPEVRQTFFDWGQFKDSFPEIARAFLLNVKIFLIAEVFILVFALLLAVIRSLPGPAALPLRILGIAYADFFRGVPTILVIAMLGFGAPALQLNWVPLSTTFWGIVALVLVYTAYVSEVYRAGIESVQDTALVGFLGSVEAFKQSQIDAAATFNYTSYVAAALLFVALTIPLARFTDWLVARDRRRRQAAGA